jgi:hypothetical protein
MDRLPFAARRLGKHPMAVCVLLGVTVLYFWPLVVKMSEAIPGTGNDLDVATFVWNVGWVKSALEGGGSLFFADKVLLPFGADLRLHTYGLLQGVMAYPFTNLLGVVGAFNLILIVTYFLNGLAVYSLIYIEVRQILPALVAAAWAMLATPMLFHFRVGRPSFAAIWIVVLAILALRRLLNGPKPGNVVVLGLLLVAALVSDLQILFYAALWLAIIGLGILLAEGKSLLDKKRVLGLVAAGLIVFLPFIFIYYPAFAEMSSGDFPEATLDGMMGYSFSMEHYLTPALVRYAYGGYEMLLASVAAVVLFRWRGPYRLWLVGAAFFFILALGPYLQPTRIPMPFAAFSLWGPLGQFRTPGRLTLPAIIGLAVVAGFLLAYLRPRIRSRWFLLTLVALAIGGRLLYAVNVDPISIQIYPQYKFYDELAEESGDFVILEVPFGIRSGFQRVGDGGEILQYYQHIHGKRTINGMIARLPKSVFAFYRSHPALVFLSGERPEANGEELAGDFANVLEWSNSRYVVLHQSLLDSSQAQTITAFLDQQPQLTREETERDLTIYRVYRGDLR